MSELAPIRQQLAEMAIDGHVPPNPLKLLPKQLVKAFGYFWMLHKTILKNDVLPMATMLATWIKQGELTEPDTLAILKRLSTPERVAGFKFPSDLTSAMAAEVTEARRRRRMMEAMAKRRAAIEVVPADDAGGFSEQLGQILKGIGK